MYAELKAKAVERLEEWLGMDVKIARDTENALSIDIITPTGVAVGSCTMVWDGTKWCCGGLGSYTRLADCRRVLDGWPMNDKAVVDALRLSNEAAEALFILDNGMDLDWIERTGKNQYVLRYHTHDAKREESKDRQRKIKASTFRMLLDGGFIEPDGESVWGITELGQKAAQVLSWRDLAGEDPEPEAHWTDDVIRAHAKAERTRACLALADESSEATPAVKGSNEKEVANG